MQHPSDLEGSCSMSSSADSIRESIQPIARERLVVLVGYVGPAVVQLAVQLQLASEPKGVLQGKVLPQPPERIIPAVLAGQDVIQGR